MQAAGEPSELAPVETDFALVKLNALDATSILPAGDHTPVDASVLGLPSALIKYRSTTICEFLGYQLARLAGVDTPQAVGFWLDTQTETAEPCRIGIAVSWLDAAVHTTLDTVSVISSRVAAAILVLSLLSRDEYPEILEHDSKTFVVDLEFLFPMLLPDVWVQASPNERDAALVNVVFSYIAQGNAVAERIRQDASRLSLESAVLSEASRLRDTLATSEFQLPGYDPAVWLIPVLKPALMARLNAYLVSN